MNFLIIAHDYTVLKDLVFQHANAIMIFKDPVLTPHQLGPKLQGLGNGHAVKRAIDDLPMYKYIFVSFDYKKWHNPFLDSRDVSIAKQVLRGRLKDSDLKEIDYPKKSSSSSTKNNCDNKRSKTINLLKQLKSYDEIEESLDTSRDTIYKIKSQERRKYQKEKGLCKSDPESKYPGWLRNRNKK